MTQMMNFHSVCVLFVPPSLSSSNPWNSRNANVSKGKKEKANDQSSRTLPPALTSIHMNTYDDFDIKLNIWSKTGTIKSR